MSLVSLSARPLGGALSFLSSLRGLGWDAAASDLAAFALAVLSSLSGMKCICLVSLVSPHMRPRTSRILESAPEEAHAAVASLAPLVLGRYGLDDGSGIRGVGEKNVGDRSDVRVVG